MDSSSYFFLFSFLFLLDILKENFGGILELENGCLMPDHALIRKPRVGLAYITIALYLAYSLHTLFTFICEHVDT